jgi:UDP-N-acetylmuramoyl-L-alanyl-D-glutamate--2,6-diaminopimelate ligase
MIDYAHSPESLQSILNAVKSYTRGRVISVFGCGGDRDSGKRPVMGQISGNIADFSVITSDNPRTESPESILKDMNSGINDFDKVFTITDRREAIKLAAQLTKGKGDIILIAGKGHETYQEINGIKYHFDDKEEVAKY